MGFFDFNDNFLNQKIFSRKYLLNEPGFILNKNISFGGERITYTRIVFFFEEILKNLYADTKAKINKKNNSKLWYGIGYDFGLRCLSFSPIRNVPFGDIEKILSLIFKLMQDFNLGLLKIERIIEDESLIISGKNFLSISDDFDFPFFSGLLAGIFSYVYGVQFKVNYLCNSNEFKQFQAVKSKKSLEIPQHIFLDEKYYFYNLPKTISKNSVEKFYSLFDFLKFKKIHLKIDSDQWTYENYPILPCEVGLFGLIFYHYDSKKLGCFFKDKIIFYSEQFFSKIFLEIPCVENRKKLFFNILSAFGWGIPHIDFSNNFIKLRFMIPPFSGYHLELRASFFNGALNAIYGKRFFLINQTNAEFIYGFED